MLQEQFNQAMEIYQSLDGVQKAVFSFWGLCVAVFYGTVLYVLYLIAKESIGRLKRSRG